MTSQMPFRKRLCVSQASCVLLQPLPDISEAQYVQLAEFSSLKQLQTLRKMKICPGRKSNRLTSLVSSAKELFLWVVVVRNANIWHRWFCVTQADLRLWIKKKVPGPNMKKKNGYESFIPITPMLPNEPPRWYMWTKRHMMPLHNPLIIHSLRLNSVIIKSHILSSTTSNKVKKALHYHWAPPYPVKPCPLSKTLENNKCWRGCRETGTLYIPWWGM